MEIVTSIMRILTLLLCAINLLIFCRACRLKAPLTMIEHGIWAIVLSIALIALRLG